MKVSNKNILNDFKQFYYLWSAECLEVTEFPKTFSVSLVLGIFVILVIVAS